MDSLHEHIPSKKRKLTPFSVETCCFCKKAFNNNKVTLDPTKFDFLLSVCRGRSNDVAENIVANEDDIRNGEIKVVYHKTCRAKFIHPFYNNTEHIRENSGHHATPSKLTRSQLKCAEFSWKDNCFICGDKCSLKHRSKWSKIEGSIDETSQLYIKLLNLSAQNGDNVLHTRLLSSHGDLVAVEARYHRKKGCLATYLSGYQEKAKQNSSIPKSDIDQACVYLKSDLFDSVENQKAVYDLSQIKTLIVEIADSKHLSIDPDKLNGKQIKRVLKRVWPELMHISRRGPCSDLVCSNSLKVEDALCKFVMLQKNLEAATEQNELESSLIESYENSEEHELSILHKAALSVRNQILKKSSCQQNEYFSSDEITTDFQKQYLDGHIMLFVRWLSGHTDDTSIEDISLTQQELSLCSDITYLVKPMTTPKHLGLSVYLHHSYGSKKLIEDLHSHGYTLSYSEVRHFLSSAALHMASVQNRTLSGGLVPEQLVASGDLIIAAADNWDHNENTLSGKKSTHAMISILVQCAPSGPAKQQPSRIPRVSDRSIDTSSLPGRGLAHTLVYHKPAQRPSPLMRPLVQPGEMCPPEPQDAKNLRLKEILYTAGRHTLAAFCNDVHVSQETIFPTWTVFQTIVQTDVLSGTTNVAFNPIIMAPPNDFNTVYTVLKRTKEQMNALGQNVCPIVFDMGLLAKALEIVWANPQEFDGVYPLEGGMHFMMSVFGGIGHIYGDIGIKQLLIKSDLFAPLTAEHILSGKDFDRALRGLIMVDEVLNQRFFYQFHKWAAENSVTVLSELGSKLEQLGIDSIQNSGEIQCLLHDIESKVLPLLESFRLEGRASSPLFRFWDDYLSEVSLPMKLYLTSSRHGMWRVHEYAKAKLFPFLFSSNRTVYSRFMPYLVLQNNRLPTELVDKFEEGRFVAKLTDGVFNSVWLDYVLEVTENKALKSSGGIIGLTHNDSALTWWFMARPVTAKYAIAYKSHKLSSSSTHHTNTPFHIQAYNTAVKKMLLLFESETFIDPFSLSYPPRGLVNIASGVELP